MKFTWAKLFLYHYICFIFLSMGIVDISFQSAGNGNHARLTRNLNFYFTQWNKNQLFCLNLTVCSILVANSTWFTSIKGAAKAAIMWKYWHILPYTVHMTVLNELENYSKHLAEWLQVLQTGLSRQSLGIRGKSNVSVSVKSSTSLLSSLTLVLR